jgi:hypothetical protein
MNEISAEMIVKDIMIRNRRITVEKEKLDTLGITFYLSEDSNDDAKLIEIHGDTLNLLEYYRCVNIICEETDATLNQANYLLNTEGIDLSLKQFAWRVLHLFEKSTIIPKLFEIQYYLNECVGIHEAYIDYIEYRKERNEVTIIPVK